MAEAVESVRFHLAAGKHIMVNSHVIITELLIWTVCMLHVHV